MKVTYANTFFESLERTLRGPRFFEKILDFFKYDLPYGIQNIFYFWKVIWKFRSYDHSYVQSVLLRALERQRLYMGANSDEIESDLNPKLEMMQKVINNLKRLEENTFIEEAEAELGELFRFDLQFEKVEGSEDLFEMKDSLTEEQKSHNGKIYRRSDELENECWEETWNIIKGHQRKMGEDGKWNEVPRDGSDMRGWWY
jgi:hypothetical protein